MKVGHCVFGFYFLDVTRVTWFNCMIPTTMAATLSPSPYSNRPVGCVIYSVQPQKLWTSCIRDLSKLLNWKYIVLGVNRKSKREVFPELTGAVSRVNLL